MAAARAPRTLGEMIRQYSFIYRVQRQIQHLYLQRLTERGRFLFWGLAAFALIGLDTRRTQVFVLFAAAAGLFVSALIAAFRPRPRVLIAGRLPERMTAGASIAIPVEITNKSSWSLPDLIFTAPEASGIVFEPAAQYLAMAPAGRISLTLRATPRRRGRYDLRSARARKTDPLRLLTSAATAGDDERVLVYPRFYRLPEFKIPLGRRYQPGGIPLSSNLGDSIEFVGTREYRPGDPVRTIHWRSWARRGEPVVKEYQEEYFCRIALILDTFLPGNKKPADDAAFEASISVLASIADYFSRSEYIVDILAAGPDVYEVSAGRSLAYLENILDVLACLDPCYDPPFTRIAPHLFEKLAQLTTVVAVLTDWDERRADFLRQVRALGTMVRAIIVRDGPTSEPWHGAAQEVGEIEVMTIADVERLLASSAAPVSQAQGAEAR